ncbi:sortase [Enterococcus silesiacus]|uniref:Sortase n=1 Tax=Enterococcus silesiacus TaxID=332949 RepID=A0AA91GAA3_9ENTE|nr:class C sortase [Enterococcus silesiacus]OJG91706.1 sortase [Enterococcus silesiacus]
MKKKIMDSIMIVVLLFGIAVLLYPIVNNALNTVLDQQIIDYYQRKANKENDEAMENVKSEMKKKNEDLAAKGSNPGADPFSNKEPENKKKVSIDYYKEHTIGVINIPKIKAKLPIFDSTNEQLLAKGTTLLSGTSYPIGGESVHSVITGHRGLPEAALFTRLPELKTKDNFYIEINNETHAYEVDQIKTVLPTDTDYLKIEQGKDMITLITCTPYMINSHRLLVRGHRIPYVAKEMDKDIETIGKYQTIKFILLGLLGLLILFILIFVIYRLYKLNKISKKSYDVHLRIVDSRNRPIEGLVLTVINKKGKRSIKTSTGDNLIFKTSNEGRLINYKLSGGKYTLVNKEKNVIIKLKIKRIKDSHFQNVIPLNSAYRFDNKEHTVLKKIKRYSKHS